ncbi:hypothetical protein DIPPA_21762 [Diplonema papillatum]|nr:hypothetical protein DIPPA_21762 [Diplonema papillatum]
MNGYWAVPQCEFCSSGYTGIACTSREISITRSGSTAASFRKAYANIKQSVILVDEEERRVIVFSTPPAVFSYESGSPVFSAPLSGLLENWKGTVEAASVSASGEYIWVVNRVSSLIEIVQVMRRALLLLFSFPLNPFAQVAQSRGYYPLSRPGFHPTSHARPSRPLAISTVTPVVSLLVDAGAYTIYDFDSVRFELHQSQISESGQQLTLVRKEDITKRIDRITTAIRWNAQLDTYLVVLGVKDGWNILLMVKLSETLLFTTLKGLGRANETELDLLHIFSGQYLFTTAVEGTTLWVVRVGLNQALANPESPTVLLKEPVLESTRTFKPVAISVSEPSGPGQLSVSFTNGTAQSPSTLYRFDPQSFEMSGSLRFGYYAGEPEDVYRIAHIPALRMSVILPATSFLRLIELNDFALISVQPTVVDMAGGTVITVRGRWLVPGDNEAYCSFMGYFIKAFNVTSNTMHCIAPSLGDIPSDPDCTGFPLEASILGQSRWSKNSLNIRVVNAATIVSVSPAFQRENTTRLLLLTGYGFADSGVLRCRLENSLVTINATAVFRSSYAVLCVIPDSVTLPASAEAYTVTVSQDGQEFPPSSAAEHRVVGAVAGIRAHTDAAVVSISRELTRLPNIEAYTVDSQGNQLSLYGLDTARRNANLRNNLSCQHGNDTFELALVSIDGDPAAVVFENGVVSIGGYGFEGRLGLCVVTLTAVAENWSTEMEISVTTGELATIRVTSGLEAALDERVPEGFAAHRYPSTLGPFGVQGFDGGGNLISPKQSTVLRADLRREADGAGVRRALAAPNEFGTEWVVSMMLSDSDLLHGFTYRLTFAIATDDSIPEIEGLPVVRQPCDDLTQISYYAVLGTNSCAECPTGGTCDGTSVVQARRGWWREAAVYNASRFSAESERIYTSFYSCGNPDACVGGGLDLCAEGYEGILCQECVSGYEKSGEDCVRCSHLALAVLYSLLLFAAACLIVAGIAHRTLTEVVQGTNNYVFVFIKLLIDYTQMLAVAAGSETTRWPSVLRAVLRVFRRAITVPVSFTPFRCLADTTIYEVFGATAAAPVVIAGVLAALYPAVAAAVARRAERGAADAAPGEEDADGAGAGDEGEAAPNPGQNSWRDVGAPDGEGEGDGGEPTPPKAPALCEFGEFVVSQPEVDDAAGGGGGDAAPAAPRQEDVVVAVALAGGVPPEAPPCPPPLMKAEQRQRVSFVCEAAPAPPRPADEPAPEAALGPRQAGGGHKRRSLFAVLQRDAALPQKELAPDSEREQAPSPALPQQQQQQQQQLAAARAKASAPSLLFVPGSPSARASRPQVGFLDASDTPAPIESGAQPSSFRLSAARYSLRTEDFDEPPSPTPHGGAATGAREGGEGGHPPLEHKRSSFFFKGGMRLDRAISATGKAQLFVDDNDDEVFGEPQRPTRSSTLRRHRSLAAKGLPVPDGGHPGQHNEATEQPGRERRPRPANQSGLHQFVVEAFSETLVDVASDPTRVTLSAAPDIAVRLTPRSPCLSFVPVTVLFTPSQPHADFTVLGSEPGEYIITWAVSGPDALQFAVPDPQSVALVKNKRITAADVVVTAWLVAFAFLHPVVTLLSAQLLQCVDINGTSYLRVSPSIQCYTSTWYTWQAVSAGSFLLYSLLLPAGVTAFVIRRWSSRAAVSPFNFLIRGYAKERWYWDFVHMARKIILIACAVYIERLVYRLFVLQWVFVGAIALHAAVQPFTLGIHNQAELSTLLALLLTMNLGMYYFRNDEYLEESEGAHLAQDPMLWVVYVGLVVLNVSVVFVLGLQYLNLYRKKLQEAGKHGMIDWLDEDGDGTITLCEMLTVLARRSMTWLPCDCFTPRLTAEEKQEKEDEDSRREAEQARRETGLAQEMTAVSRKGQLQKDRRLGKEEADGADNAPDTASFGSDDDHIRSPTHAPDAFAHLPSQVSPWAAPTIQVSLEEPAQRPQPSTSSQRHGSGSTDPTSPQQSYLSSMSFATADRKRTNAVSWVAQHVEAMDPDADEATYLAGLMAEKEWRDELQVKAEQGTPAAAPVEFRRAVELGLAKEPDRTEEAIVRAKKPKASLQHPVGASVSLLYAAPTKPSRASNR